MNTNTHCHLSANTRCSLRKTALALFFTASILYVLLPGAAEAFQRHYWAACGACPAVGYATAEEGLEDLRARTEEEYPDGYAVKLRDVEFYEDNLGQHRVRGHMYLASPYFYNLGGIGLWKQDCGRFGWWDSRIPTCVSYRPNEERNLGPGCKESGCPNVGNPINITNGNKYESVRLFNMPGFSRGFSLEYNSLSPRARWRMGVLSSLETRADEVLSLQTQSPWAGVLVIAHRPDGRILRFVSEYDNLTGAYVGDAFVSMYGATEELHAIRKSINGRTAKYLVRTNRGVAEYYDGAGNLIRRTAGRLDYTYSYDSQGRLIRIEDAQGHRVSLSYLNDTVTVISQDGKIYQIVYSGSEVTELIYPDATPSDAEDNPRKIFHYDNANYPYLTGITNENGVRYATWRYDHKGRATESEHAGGVEQVTVSHGFRTVYNALGGYQRFFPGSLGLKEDGLMQVPTVFDVYCEGCIRRWKDVTYDSNGFLSSRTDFTGAVTTYSRDVRGHELSRVEAVGSADERTIQTQWHSVHRKPSLIIEAIRTTAYTYNEKGQPLSETVTDRMSELSRSTSDTYDNQ